MKDKKAEFYVNLSRNGIRLPNQLAEFLKTLGTSELEAVSDKIDGNNFIRLQPFNKGHIKVRSGNRITLPEDLIKYAGLENKVALLKYEGCIEVWNASTFAEYSKELDDRFGSSNAVIDFSPSSLHI